MIRILVIDDAETPEFLEGMAREIAGGYRTEVDPRHLNPATAFKGGNEEVETAELIAEVRVRAGEFWDVALIDINLNDLDRPEAERLDLSLSIAETFREHNQAAVVMLYSGTLAKHIPKLIQEDRSSQKTDSEKALKRIFEAGIAGFVPRDELRQRVYSALEEPPALLGIDRLLTRNSALTCKGDETEFEGRNFQELAAAVRRQDKLGRRVAELVVEFGVASLAELERVMHTVRKAVCLHAKADDLTFLNPVRNRLGKILGDSCQSFELGDQHSHADALLALERAAGAFVVIFAHGGSDYLRGGEYFSRRTGGMVEVEKFLTRQNLQIFNGRVVFCLSCDSNGLAQASLEAGALAFVGFDEVPFNRFDSAGHPIGSKVLIQHTQTLIADAVKAALESFVTGRLTLYEAIDYLRLWIDQHAVRYVRRNASVPDRRDIAALFLKVKDGVRYHGERDIRFAHEA